MMIQEPKHQAENTLIDLDSTPRDSYEAPAIRALGNLSEIIQASGPGTVFDAGDFTFGAS